MPLEKIRIRGFQAHDDLTVVFDPRITTVQGPSDAGKSAIVRALRWLAFNRPAGDEFRRRGAKRVAVDLRVDGKKISRKKNGGNAYYLDGQKFAGDNTRGVPAEISRLLNLGELNFAGQFAGPFWLADTPGAVSRQLNAIVDLGVIDDTLAAVAGRLRKAGAAVAVSRERRAAARGELERLAWVPGYLDKLGDLERAAERIARKRRRRDALAAAIEEVESAERAARNAGPAAVAGRTAVAAGERWAVAAARRGELAELIAALTNSELEQAKTAAAARRAAREFEQRTRGRSCPVCGGRLS